MILLAKNCSDVFEFVTVIIEKNSWLLFIGHGADTPCRYCFYSVVQKWVFRPTGAIRCPDKRIGPLPRAKFHVYRGRNVGIQPPKL